jgi:hypothetical protein
MDLNLMFVITGGFLVTVMILLRVFAPGLYNRYVLRGARPRASSSGKSSRVLAAGILLALIFMAVYSFLTRGRTPAIERPVAPNIPAMHVESWIAFLCVLATGIVLWLFPVAALTKLLLGTVDVSLADEKEKRKIKIIMRAFGTLFLTVAAVIARQLR